MTVFKQVLETPPVGHEWEKNRFLHPKITLLADPMLLYLADSN